MARNIKQQCILLALLLLAFALRVYRLDAQSFWSDEARTVVLAEADLNSVFRWSGEPQFPHYFLLMRVLEALFGRTDFSLRYTSLFAGVLLIPVCYIVARRLFNQRVAAAAVIVASVSPLYIFYAQELRMYALLALLSAGSTYVQLKLIDSAHGSARLWLIYIVLSVLNLYTHFYAILVFAAQQVIWSLLCLRARRIDRRWLLSLVVIGLCYLPTLSLLQQSAIGFSRVADAAAVSAPARWDPWFYGWQVFKALLWGVAYFSAEQYPPLLVVVGTLVAVLVVLRMRPSFAVAYLAVLLIVPWVLSYGAYVRLGQAHPRYMIFLALPLFLAVAAAWESTSRMLRGWFVARTVFDFAVAAGFASSLAFALVQYYYNPAFQKGPDYRALLRSISAYAVPSDALALNFGDQELLVDYYLHGAGLDVYRVPQIVLDPQRGLVVDTTATQTTIERIFADHPRVWWLRDPVDFDRSGFTRRWLDQHYANPYQLIEGFAFVNLYGRNVGALNVKRSRVNFGDKIALLAAGLPGEPLQPGDALIAALDWQAKDRIAENDLTVLRLYDQAGHLIASHTQVPGNGIYPTDTWTPGETIHDQPSLLLPLGLAPGVYRAQLSLYSSKAKTSLNVFNDANQPLGEQVELGTIAIAPGRAFPSASLVPVQQRLMLDLNDELTLVGIDDGAINLPAGVVSTVSLLWQARVQPPDDYRRTLLIRNARGEVIASAGPADIGADYPTHLWRVGEIVQERVDLRVLPRAEEGQAQMILRVEGQNDEVVGDHAIAGVQISARARNFARPMLDQPIAFDFNRQIRLIGYTLDAREVERGKSLSLHLYWEALSGLDTDYKIFTHLLDAQQHIDGQRDVEPEQGTAPTTTWVTGEFITDSIEIPVAPSASVGDHTLEIGLYDQNGARLRLADGSDHLILGSVAVK